MSGREQVAQTVSEAASGTAAKATYAGGALSAVGGMALSNEAIALIGVALAVMGWVTQVYFGLRRDKREAEEHDLKMIEIRDRVHSRR